MRFLIIFDSWKPKAEKLAGEIQNWLREKGIDSVLKPEDLDGFGDEPPMALLLGGDGFINRNGYELAKRDIPFLGINFGTVGYLAIAEPSEWEKAVQRFLDGRYKIERRKVLKGSLGKEKFYAVNDVVLHRGLQKLVRMKVKVDGRVVYRNIGGDGMIVCSAIGSTAYNLAAGGPIIETGFGLTPIAVHRINIKPLPLPEDKVIEIICLGGSFDPDAEYVLEVDGDNSRRVRIGDKIKVQYSDSPIIVFIVPEGFSFIKSLQDKLGLTK